MLPGLPVALITLLSLASASVAIPANFHRAHDIGPRATGRKCGNELTSEAISEREKTFAFLLAEKKASRSFAVAEGNFTVPVNFNVIYASMNIYDGYVPDSQIQAQIDVLNQDYNGTGLSFQLQNITRVLNPAWFNNVAPNTNEQTAMKRTLRQGDVKTLNIYTVGFNNSSAQNITGYTTQPADYAANPMNDGVVVVYSTLPGGSQAPFNLGRSLTHEVGHWVGLLHPFQGGCDGPNDYVDDTPAEASPAYGCPIGRDTCPSPGLDPVQNFMDYSDDSCMNNFTPGQIARLKSQISTYRGINL